MRGKIRPALAFALLPLVLHACGGMAPGLGFSFNRPTFSPTSTYQPGATIPNTGKEIDLLLIDMMVPHQETVIEMAALAATRASHPELVVFSEELIKTQQTEIAELREWRQTWYGSPETPPNTQTPILIELDPGQEGVRITDLEVEVDVLRQADDRFEQAFLERLIAHQQEAIQAAHLVLEQPARSQTKYLAEKMIQARLEEIQKLQEMQDHWYSPPEPAPYKVPLGVRT